MRRLVSFGFTLAGLLILAQPACAQLTSPQIGWQAELATYFHDVSGTVTIVNESTIRVDDFTYDGQGPAVYFYLGAEQSQNGFIQGIPIGPLLTGTPYDGSQEPLFYSLAPGNTLEGWHAISVWCVDFSADFGSGTFVDVGPTSGDFNNDGQIDAADYAVWRNNAEGTYSPEDYQLWRSQYGAGAAGQPAEINAAPEPGALACSAAAVLLAAFRTHQRARAAVG